jgi:peptide/nickel transport system substrate-binding protein
MTDGRLVPTANPLHASTRRHFLVRVGGATFALSAGSSFLAACGASSSKSSKDVPLRVGILTDLDTLNPMSTVDSLETHWLVYDKLMVYNQHLVPALSLATSRQVSPDAKTITFKIHPDAKFHDGKPLTSTDVQFSFELVKSTGLSFAAPYLTDLETVDTPDAQTVVANYSKPPADDPGVMTAILPKHIWQGMSKNDIIKFTNSQMIGSGAFKFGNRKTGASWEFVRNPDWWGTAPGIASVSWIVYANPQSLAIALQQGTLDVTYPLSASIWKGAGGSDVVAKAYPPLGFDHFAHNVAALDNSKGNPLLKDRVVRQALALSLDREKLIQLVLEGQGSPGTTVIPPAMAQWHADIPASELLNNDPARAQAMLDAAGYRMKNGVRVSPSGQPLHFRLYTSTVFDRLKSAAELIVQMAKNIGVTYDLTVMQDAQLAGKVFTDIDYDSFVWTWTTPPNPTFMLSVQSCDTFGVLSDTYYCEPSYQDLFNAQKVEPNVAKRQQMVKQAQTLFYQDAAYAVLYYPNVLEAYRTDSLTGWLNQPNGVVDNWTDANYLALQPA